MGRLSLELLGSPAVRHDGQEVAFPTRKTLALLAYLAVERGPHTRDKLIALFWPDSDSVHGQAVLRRTLARLREALGEAVASVPHVQATHDALRFLPAADADVDTARLESAWQLTAVAPGAVGRGPNAANAARGEVLAHLAAGLAAYRGDFLDGFSLADAPDFDDWVAVQREHWHRRLAAVGRRLAEVQAAGGELAAALETARRLIRHHSTDEAAYRLAMELHLAAGDRAGGLDTYAGCCAALARAWGGAPDTTTQALAARLRAAPLGSARRPAAPGPPRRIFEAPLVGRADEFAALQALYGAAAAGHPRAAILLGEAGIGKTRLAATFLGWAGAQGAVVLEGRAFESGGRLAYGPLVDALRGRLDRQPLGDELGPVWRAELGRLLPELREGVPDRSERAPARDGDDSAAQARLFEAVARLGSAWAAEAPLVLLVDDLQWADTATLDLLAYAARRWACGAVPIFFLLTARTEELAHPTHPEAEALGGWLAGLERVLPCRRLLLGPLTVVDTARLVQGWGGTAPAEATAMEALASWLFDETGGQPFFLTETLQALLEQGLVRLAATPAGGWRVEPAGPGATWAPPAGLEVPGVRALIRQRLDRLGAPARTLLATGAVLGAAFTFEQLCAVGDLGHTAGLTALDEGLASGLLQEGALPGRGRPAQDRALSHRRELNVPNRTRQTWTFRVS